MLRSGDLVDVEARRTLLALKKAEHEQAPMGPARQIAIHFQLDSSVDMTFTVKQRRTCVEDVCDFFLWVSTP